LNNKPIIYDPALSGQKIYLRVYSFNNEEGNPFSICIFNSPTCTPVTVDQTQAICNGASFSFGTTVLTKEGSYSQTFKRTNGCDSLVNLELTVKPVYNLKDTITVCRNANFTFPDGQTVQNIDAPLVHTSNLVTKNKCDSVISTYIEIFEIETMITATGYTLTAQAAAEGYQWIDCNNSFAEISGETNASFTPFQNGNYAVRISQNGCADFSACYPVVILDAGDDEWSSLKIYPNPCSDNIFVDPPVNVGVTVELLDMQGRTLILRSSEYTNFKQTLSINTAQLSAGIYLIRVTSQSRTWISKQIIK
jgi:hypothetical protein